jgi:hypothetical protein
VVEGDVVGRDVGGAVFVRWVVLVVVLPAGVPRWDSVVGVAAFLVVGEAALLFPVTKTTMAIKTTTSTTTPNQSAHRLGRGRFARGAAGDGGVIPPASDDKVVAPWPAGRPVARLA